jgi:hypothetical protein
MKTFLNNSLPSESINDSYFGMLVNFKTVAMLGKNLKLEAIWLLFSPEGLSYDPPPPPPDQF